MRVKNSLSVLAVVMSAALLSGCYTDEFDNTPYYTLSKDKADTPLSADMRDLILQKGMRLDAPIMLRIIKEEDKLEVWKMRPNGRYAHLKDYEICAWSGEYGRKKQEGDRQAPEGFYHITPALMNPYSNYFLAFNTGFPNTYDRAHGFTGSNLMVHGACSSRGCYSMTDEQIGEIYALARDAFDGGQTAFQLQAIPFRLTPENLARHHDHPEFDFWLNLKEGLDHFEVTNVPPAVDVCDKRYVYNAVLDDGVRMSAREACPAFTQPPEIVTALAQVREVDNEKLEKLVERESRRKEREIARVKRQKALEARFSLNRDRGEAAEPANASVETAAVDASDATVPRQTVSVEGTPAPNAPVPRPRPGGSNTAAVEEKPRGLGLGRLFSGFGRRSQEPPAAVEDTTLEAAQPATAGSVPSGQLSVEAAAAPSAATSADGGSGQLPPEAATAESGTQPGDAPSAAAAAIEQQKPGLLSPGRWLRAFNR